MAPGRTRRSPCRPGTRASGGGRTGPAGTAGWLLGPRSEGSSCSPRWGCRDGRSACSCWLADPWGCRKTSRNLDQSLFTRRFLWKWCEKFPLQLIEYEPMDSLHQEPSLLSVWWFFHSTERVRMDASLWQSVSDVLWCI